MAARKLRELLVRATTLKGQVLSPSVGPIPSIDLERPFRLAVVGGLNTGKSSLVNVLLDTTKPTTYVSAALSKDEHRIQRLRFGETFREVADTENSRAVDLEVPVTWLQNKNVQLIDSPGYGAWLSTQSTLDASLDDADAVILLTDVSRQLTDASEVSLLRRLADKRPVVVINQIDRFIDSANPSMDQARVIARANASIFAALDVRLDDGLVLGEPLLVLAVSAKLASAATAVFGQKEYSDLWQKSGMGPLVDHIQEHILKDDGIRNLLKCRTAVTQLEKVSASIRSSLERRRLQLSRKLEEIEAAREPLEAFRKSFKDEFDSRDLLPLEKSQIRLRRYIVKTFNSISTRQLILHPASISSALQSFALNDVSLRELEYQTSYAIGRLNEGARLLLERVERTLTRIAADPQLAAHPATESLSAELLQLRDSLPQRRRVADTYVLANVVWESSKELDPRALGNTLQRRMQMRLALVGFTGVSGVVGVAISHSLELSEYITFGLGASTAGLAYLGYLYIKMAWTSGADKLSSKVGKFHRQLREKLSTVADEQVKHVALEPTDDALLSAAKLLQAKLDWVKQRRSEADELVENVRKLKDEIQSDAHRQIFSK